MNNESLIELLDEFDHNTDHSINKTDDSVSLYNYLTWFEVNHPSDELDSRS